MDEVVYGCEDEGPQEHIEIFRSSRSEGNPYHIGDKEHLDESSTVKPYVR